MTKRGKKIIRYSTCFKLQVVEEIEKNGLSVEDCRRKYGIGGGQTIQEWIKKLGKHHLLNKVVRVETRGELDELKRLRAENKALKEAYAELALNHKCSEKVIEVADEMFNLDLKKKYEHELSVYFKEEEAVSRLCLYFGISRQAYYKSNNQMVKSALKTGIVVDMVQKVRRQMPRLGGKKLYHLLGKDLRQVGSIGRDKFFDILRDNDLLVVPKRSYTRTTQSYHRFYKWTNLVRDMQVTRSNQVWVSDITYLRTLKGFVYLFLITDLYSRKIVGWSLSRSLAIKGAMEALRMALRGRKDKALPLTHHSDRGIQYCSTDYVRMLQKANVQISMTEENHCYENSTAERVNGILKDEFYLDHTFHDYLQALKAVRSSVEIYNNKRPHWALNLLTPEQVHASKVA